MRLESKESRGLRVVTPTIARRLLGFALDATPAQVCERFAAEAEFVPLAETYAADMADGKWRTGEESDPISISLPAVLTQHRPGPRPGLVCTGFGLKSGPVCTGGRHRLVAVVLNDRPQELLMHDSSGLWESLVRRCAERSTQG